MAIETGGISEALAAGQSLAVADRVLIDPDPGSLAGRVDELIVAVTSEGNAVEVCRTLIRLGMNFAGRDAEIVGYSADEAVVALDKVLAAAASTDASDMQGVVDEFLADMKSVNAADSLSGLLAERIEGKIDSGDPGGSFLKALKAEMRGGVYWRMIGEKYCKFGNDFARGLEYLRHYGFCQVSTNPVLAAKAFDEDPGLTETLKEEIAEHSDWKDNPDEHADEIAMAATLIALWPNLAIYRPLALHTSLKDYMVSFQLNPNIADRAEESIEDARSAFKVASDFLTKYDKALGLGERSGALAPNLVFKVAASHEAAREITTVLNSEGVGTNNTVVYTVSQEVQLILDAFEGKATAAKAGRDVVRTYETNMGGRFTSHLREVEGERIFKAAAAKAGDAKANGLLDALAADTGASDPGGSVAERAAGICAYATLKTLEHPQVIAAAEAAGESAESVQVMEADLKKAGTLVARRVYWVYYAPENRPKWVTWLQKQYGVSEDQATWILESMDVLPASKRIPEDTLHALGAQNMCHTEFPNHLRAVQLASEQPDFDLTALKESILDTYDPGVSQRLYELPDYPRGFDLTPELAVFLQDEVGVDVGSWQTKGMQPGDWQGFGSVQKTSKEFRAAYDTFTSMCVSVAKEVG